MIPAMTGMLIIIVLAALLIAALAPAHRRSTPTGFRPGADTTADVDRARLRAELRAAAQR